MKIIKITDSKYPQRLKNIKNPPKILYALGDINLLNKESIAIVGTRNSTAYGRGVAQKFAKEISEQGICVVSGLAEGIDTFAHVGAKGEIGKTIAVMGNGLNRVYPSQNKKLFLDILNEGGCIISEYEPDEEERPENFPARNRIISGISMGILVIEARHRSGSSITARYAREQNKAVFCIPRDIDKVTGRLTNDLIKEGAILVTSPSEIVDYYPKKHVITGISEEFRDVYKYIGEVPITVDELCRLTNMSVAAINEKLMLMELDGIIKNVIGGYIRVLENQRTKN